MAEVLEVAHSADVKAWQQQDKESSLHHWYFCTYRDLGPQRSIIDTVKALVADPEIKAAPSKETLQGLQAAHRWQYRAELFDRHQLATEARLKAEQRREELRISLEEFQQIQQKMGRGLSSLAARVLAKTTAAVDANDNWDIATAQKFMSTLNQTAQTAAGLWSDSLGVSKLQEAMESMEAAAAEEVSRLDS